LTVDPRPGDEGLLRAMARAIAHRGPDAQGVWCDRHVGLAHRRLSIIDLEGGDQPIGNEDGSIQVVLNGEIYNYRRLREELLGKGHQFRTDSDTEVLVHLYEEMGERLVERLRGMYAFAIWDRRQRRLLLARDRVGQKPLYYYRDDEKLLFASELKAILACEDVSREVDLEALEDYVTFGVVPGERSIFRRIRKLPAAHTLVVSPERLDASPRRYWQLEWRVDEGRSVEAWLEAIQEKLVETVEAHRIADVPVGAFLSGGVDSSAIVAAWRETGEDPPQTFSVGFQEDALSEIPYARQVARRYGTRHVEEIVTPQAAESLDDLVRFYDEPFADSSAVPTMSVAKVARRHVKVVLSGDGGDEAFGGYSRYAHDLKEARLRQWLPRWLRRHVLATAARIWPKADWLPRPLRAKTMLMNLSLDPQDAYANTISQCRSALRRCLLSADVRRHLNGYRPEAMVSDAYCTLGGDALRGMIGADVAMLLPDDFLTKVDRASMAVGLEVRPPLVDHEFLELAARIPSWWKVRHGETKWIFKRLMHDRLPSEVTSRRKQGFELPVDAWLRGPLRGQTEATLLDDGSPLAQWLDVSVVRSLLRSHQSGRGRHGQVLWSLLVLGKWADKYLSSRISPREAAVVAT
jgi:asparagine synthase (glutamine-hydrolysing)